MLKRVLVLPKKASFFLFGPRQTGKSTLLKQQMPGAIWFNLLEEGLFFRYTKAPELFRKELEELIARGERVFIVDEIQRAPGLLNEVHAAIEAHGVRFALSASSSRKLKRGGSNLLGGRAVLRHLYPFTYAEIGASFDLETVLHHGTLPAVYGKDTEERRDLLKSYVQVYLREEIQAEGLSRNLGGFARFLDLAANHNAELINFSAIARECHLPVRTVQSYYEILEDTLIAIRLPAYSTSMRERLSQHPKYYFFDTGVVNALNLQLKQLPSKTDQGKLFEQWMVLEILRHVEYHDLEYRASFWRTHDGSEVDLLLESGKQVEYAIEFKFKATISSADTRGLRAFSKIHPKAKLILFCTVPRAYKIENVKVLPWQEMGTFLDD
jgi:predicted AAA+ superfamily ATPase